jgi:hypothetical protein
VQTRPVQLRFATEITSDKYVTERAWHDASLRCCPLHPGGGCGFARHGTYERVQPPGCLIARYYCPAGHRTFSLLPDCLAARLRGSIDEVEQVVKTVEQSPSVEVAAGKLRPDIELPGAVRWTRRRLAPVRMALLALVTLFPDKLGSTPTVTGVCAHLGRDQILMAMREIAGTQLWALPHPLGFHHRGRDRDRPIKGFQHETGPDARAGPR